MDWKSCTNTRQNVVTQLIIVLFTLSLSTKCFVTAFCVPTSVQQQLLQQTSTQLYLSSRSESTPSSRGGGRRRRSFVGTGRSTSFVSKKTTTITQINNNSNNNRVLSELMFPKNFKADVLHQMLDTISYLDVTVGIGSEQTKQRKQQRLVVQQQQTSTSTKLTTTTNNNKKASIPNLTTSLIKQIVGGCVLALPACVASLSNAGVVDGSGSVSCTGIDDTFIIPYVICVISIMGLINAYYFSLVGRVCTMTGATSFHQAWELTVGNGSSQIIATILSMKTMLSCLAYAMILGDSFAGLANQAHIVDHIVTRIDALEVIGIFVLLPLCLQRDLSSLAPFSLIGLLMILITVSTIIYRSVDGTYQIAQTGTILIPPTTTIATTPLGLEDAYTTTSALSSSIQEGITIPDIPTMLTLDGPSLSLSNDIISTASTIVHAAGDVLTNSINIDFIQNTALLACTLITAFVAHYNAPRFHSELENNTIERFHIVTGTSYIFASIVFAAVAITGYLTFGSSTLPFVLNNYSSNDTLIAIGNAAVAISICLTFPLPFVGLRDGVMDAMQISKDDRTDTIQVMTSIALLLIVLILASLVTDLRTVLSIGGGTFSTAVAAILPTIMFRSAVYNNNTYKNNKNNSISTTSTGTSTEQISNVGSNNTTNIVGKNLQWNEIEANFALGLMSFCVAIGGTGVSIAIQNVM